MTVETHVLEFSLPNSDEDSSSYSLSVEPSTVPPEGEFYVIFQGEKYKRFYYPGVLLNSTTEIPGNIIEHIQVNGDETTTVSGQVAKIIRVSEVLIISGSSSVRKIDKSVIHWSDTFYGIIEVEYTPHPITTFHCRAVPTLGVSFGYVTPLIKPVFFSVTVSLNKDVPYTLKVEPAEVEILADFDVSIQTKDLPTISYPNPVREFQITTPSPVTDIFIIQGDDSTKPSELTSDIISIEWIVGPYSSLGLPTTARYTKTSNTLFWAKPYYGVIKCTYREHPVYKWTLLSDRLSGHYYYTAGIVGIEHPIFWDINVIIKEEEEKDDPYFTYEVSPNQVDTEEPFDVKVYASHLFSMIWPHAGQLPSYTEAAITHANEVQVINGDTLIECDYPIADLFSVHAIGNIINKDGDIIYEAGDEVECVPNLSRLKLSKALFGSVAVSYISYDAQVFPFSGLLEPGVYFGMLKSIIFTEPQLWSIEVKFTNTRTAYLTVRNQQGIPIPNAVVLIDGVNKGQSDSEGKIDITGLTPGRHTMEVQADGYTSGGASNITEFYL